MSIICGTDLSPASSSALEVARALAAQRGDTDVVLVHVVDAEPESDVELDRLRARLDAQARSSGEPAVRTELIIGPPDETLVGFAETEGSDLIVIAARSRHEQESRLGT